MKKLLSTFFASSLILSTGITSFANDANSYTPSPESDFSVQNNNISAYYGEGGLVVIPPEVDGQAITGLDNEIFIYGGGAVTTLVLPDYIESVGHFNGSIFLEDLIIGNPDLSLGLWTFDDSPWKTSKEFLTTDNGKLLAYNGEDSVVTVPDYVTSIGEYSVEGTSATTFILPSSVTTIHDCAFWNNDSLKAIYMPTSVTEIQPLPFFTTVTDATITIYYEGTEAQKNQMTLGDIESGVEELIWVYNSTIESVPSAPQDAQPEEPTSPVHDAWATGIVEIAVENDLIVDSLGMDYTKSITRLQIADLLVNMVEKTSGTVLETGDEAFTDTSSEAVSKAAEAGIIGGKGNGIFDPDNTATRQEISIMIVRAIEKLEELSGETYVDHSQTTLEGYSDFADTAVWAQDFVAILANNGIMAGSGGNLTPLSATSIQECIVLNNNLFKLGK